MIRFGKVLLILLPFFLCGCLEMSQEIFINKDGGGRIVEKFMMSTAAIEKLTGLFAAFPGAEGAKTKKTDMYDRKKLKADAAKYGPGVQYVSSRKLNTDTQEGYEVQYAFKDINTLRINQNPSDKGPKPADATSNAKQEDITFQFEKGNPATLTVIFPGKPDFTKEKKRTKDKRDKTAKKQATEEVREFLKDLYIGIKLHPEGKIVETDATYNEDGTITLLEMDFNKLLTDQKEFESFAKKEPESVEEAKALLKKLPGFKIELNEKVVIKFE